MANKIKLKEIVNHILNGSFGQNICLLCLTTLDEFSENIFTSICTEENEYCVADILYKVFNIEVLDNDEYSVCTNCYVGALNAYKFFLQTKRSQEVLDYYIDQLSTHLDDMNNSLKDTDQINGEIACITLPLYVPETCEFNIDLETYMSHYIQNKEGETKLVSVSNVTFDNNNVPIKTELEIDASNIKREMDSDGYIFVMNESNKSQIYKLGTGGDLTEIDGGMSEHYLSLFGQSIVRRKRDDAMAKARGRPHKKMKERKKRTPMEYITCSECPVKYRFTSKLKEHMKIEHNIDLFICKVCKAIVQDESEFHTHLKTHTNIYICAACGVVLKKRDSMVAHLRRHDDGKATIDGSHVCEICGQILQDEISLKEHCFKKHDKKHICFYCGRSYKGAFSLEQHIKKHEMYLKDNSYEHKCEHCDKVFPLEYHLEVHMNIEHTNKAFECKQCNKTYRTQAMLVEHEKTHSRSFHCEKCGRGFVDARALMWHQRLHNNERPYICETCGRGFISLNRRNQHALCAHSAPARRCPLCPALFHLRSMVNTHIRKVHLKVHQRRNRSSKYQDVYWRTETVPIQELSVAVQNELLEMQTNVQPT